MHRKGFGSRTLPLSLSPTRNLNIKKIEKFLDPHIIEFSSKIAHEIPIHGKLKRLCSCLNCLEVFQFLQQKSDMNKLMHYSDQSRTSS